MTVKLEMDDERRVTLPVSWGGVGHIFSVQFGESISFDGDGWETGLDLGGYSEKLEVDIAKSQEFMFNLGFVDAISHLDIGTYLDQDFFTISAHCDATEITYERRLTVANFSPRELYSGDETAYVKKVTIILEYTDGQRIERVIDK